MRSCVYCKLEDLGRICTQEGGKFSHLQVPLREIDHKRARNSLHKSFISGNLSQIGYLQSREVTYLGALITGTQ